MKLCETSKLKTGEKYCLSFHPSQSFRDLQEMGGVRLNDLKDHTNGIGGSWGSDTWACLVRDDTDLDFDKTEVGQSGLDNTKSKRALLIPVSVFTSTQIMKICDLLGQNEDYRRFGADEETPSGVEDDSGYRNSTQVSGSQGLSIQMSRIEDPEEEDMEFDNISPEKTFMHDESEEVDNDGTLLHGASDFSEHTSVSNINFQCVECRKPFETQNDLNTHVTEEHEASAGSSKPRSKNMSKRDRSITEISKHNKTYYVCGCGYSSLHKSACTRHKCRDGDSVLFNCLECTKVCKNPGSLKRHVDSKHKKVESSVMEESTFVTDNEKTHQENVTNVDPEHIHEDNLCTICGKKLKNKINLMKHMERLHKSQVEDSVTSNDFGEPASQEPGSHGQKKGLSDTRIRSMLSNTVSGERQNLEKSGGEFPCDQCGKILKSLNNMKRHMELLHKSRKEVDDVPNAPTSELSDQQLVDNQEAIPPREGRNSRVIRNLRRRSTSLLRHKGKRKF